MKRFIDRINGLYVVWLLGMSAVAFVEPRTMLGFDQRWIFWSLVGSMLGMGLSLAPDDFRAAAGVLLRWLLPQTAHRLGACGPTIAMLAFVFVTAGIVAASAAAGVFSGVMQNVLGGLLATFWKRREAGR
jgi:predicted Na+-dependent transporter